MTGGTGKGPKFPPPYLPLELPERFALEIRADGGNWLDWAALRGQDFVRLDDGSDACEGDGSPTFLRCIGYGGGYFLHVDGAGDVYAYRLVPLPPVQA